MASSASGQDESNRALWLATRAGKMEPSCPLGTTRCIPQAKFHQKPYNKSFIDQVCSVKMAGYWPRSFFASLWTSTSSRSINTQKKNLANIQPSWPHTWSITHTYWSKLQVHYRFSILHFPQKKLMRPILTQQWRNQTWLLNNTTLQGKTGQQSSFSFVLRFKLLPSVSCYLNFF